MMLFGYGRENRLSYPPRKRFTVLNLTHDSKIVQFSSVHSVIFSKNLSSNYTNNNELSALTLAKVGRYHFRFRPQRGSRLELYV